jgi:CubicO group peptidase (beta-lactamase class C family)
MTRRLLLLGLALPIAAGAQTPTPPLTRPNPTVAAAPAPLTGAELGGRLAKLLDSLSALDQFSGVVVLVKDGAALFQRAYGMADREAGRPNDLETAFNLGSINKVFTATAIRQLAATGKLHLDSSLGRYWPDYPNASARRVTIKQLLEHSSGIGGNIFAAPPGGTRSDLRRLQDFLPLFVNDSLQFAPGARRQYSNAGYIVLGLLVERLSGEDYFNYVERHIFRPAGMTRTGHWSANDLPGNTALGYTRATDQSPLGAAAGPVHPNTALLPGRGSSAGGGYSTAQDLVRFIQALRARGIPGGPPPGIGAAGGAPGINAVIEGDLPGGYDLIVLANLGPPAAERVSQMVRSWLGARS